MSEELYWTREEFLLFKEKYLSAIKERRGSFFFQGSEFLVDYARYVIEYLESTNLKK